MCVRVASLTWFNHRQKQVLKFKQGKDIQLKTLSSSSQIQVYSFGVSCACQKSTGERWLLSLSNSMWLSQQELSQANAWNVLSIIDPILGINAVKRRVFCICSDRVALDRRSSIQDATNICLEHPQSWSPKNLTVCARLIKVLPPCIED